MVVSARQHVYLQSPFFLPDATLAEALTTAALSGIDVKVMVSARPSGNRLPDWAGNTFIEEIVTAGVRVFLYDKGYLHAKTISIDSEICSIGSANIDIRSFSINYELNAVFYSEQVAKQLETDFERDLAYCTEFDPEEYRKRGTWRASEIQSRGSSRRCCDDRGRRIADRFFVRADQSLGAKKQLYLARCSTPSKCPACFVIYELRSNCAPLQTKVPAVLIVTAIYSTNQRAEIDRIAFE